LSTSPDKKYKTHAAAGNVAHQRASSILRENHKEEFAQLLGDTRESMGLPRHRQGGHSEAAKKDYYQKQIAKYLGKLKDLENAPSTNGPVE